MTNNYTDMYKRDFQSLEHEIGKDLDSLTLLTHDWFRELGLWKTPFDSFDKLTNLNKALECLGSDLVSIPPEQRAILAPRILARMVVRILNLAGYYRELPFSRELFKELEELVNVKNAQPSEDYSSR